MKISKKVFALLLAVVLMLSVLAVGASAAGTAQGDEWMTVTITTDKGTEEYDTGETVTVTVSVACNYNVPTFRFPIMYDKSVLKTKTLLGQEALGNCASLGSLTYNKNADNCIPEEYNPDEWGCVLFQWVANAQSSVGCINNPEGEAVFSFKLETTSDSAGKTGTIFIPSESNLIYYQAIEDPEVATSFYYLTPETCTMTFVPANVTIMGSDATLIPNTAYGTPGIVDEDNLLVYGLATGLSSLADVKQFVTTSSSSATINVVPTDLGYGTGSQINLLVGGEVVKSYTMIIFGDVNGDGDVTGDDVLDLVAFFGLTKSPESDAIFKAADIGVPQDEDINGTDVLREVGLFGLTVSIDQADPYAE